MFFSLLFITSLITLATESLDQNNQFPAEIDQRIDTALSFIFWPIPERNWAMEKQRKEDYKRKYLAEMEKIKKLKIAARNARREANKGT